MTFYQNVWPRNEKSTEQFRVMGVGFLFVFMYISF